MYVILWGEWACSVEDAGAPPQVGLAVVVQVDPAVGRKLAPFDDWPRLVHGPWVDFGRVLVEHARPQQRAAPLRGHGDAQVREVGLPALLHVREVEES